ncbi:hypothetical protein Taro_010589 [Colocasia esculenta]|uniref:Uncharacterized protein n=1 Tax=Colocasia esculenta TaxID=4460 RepID=A0A843U3Z6_COLES|nr:hypothetical protein [Colocasia esculenta]
MIVLMYFKLRLDRHLVIYNIFIFISRSIYWLGLGVFISILTILSNVVFFIILSNCRTLTLEFSGHNPINHFVAHPVSSSEIKGAMRLQKGVKEGFVNGSHKFPTTILGDDDCGKDMVDETMKMREGVGIQLHMIFR